MKKQTILTGYLLILAAISFWISWFLMPDPGTTDTNHILNIVKQSRDSVLFSVIIQIISSVFYTIALFLLVKISSPQRNTLIGIALLGIGAMGLCADAFFHLLAYFMTGESVNIQDDVVRVMNFMQTKGLIFLIPLLLPFFIGSLVLAIGLKKQDMISKTPKLIFVAVFLIGLISVVASKLYVYKGPIPIFAMLSIFAAGQAFIGFELVKLAKKENELMVLSDLQILTQRK